MNLKSYREKLTSAKKWEILDTKKGLSDFVKEGIKPVVEFFRGTGIGNYTPFSLYRNIDNLLFKYNMLNSYVDNDDRFAKIYSNGEEFKTDIKKPRFLRRSKKIYRGKFEEKTTNLFKRIIEKGENAVDIGANIGYYTHLFSLLVGDTGLVFSFEPEPTNFEILKRNSFRNTIIEKKAVSNKNGFTELYLSEDCDGLHSIVSKQGEDSIDVETVALDSYLSDFEQEIGIVKIDVEGAEKLVLEGMENRLISDKPNLVIEFIHFLPNHRNILEKLRNIGYSFYTIREGGHLSSSSLEKMEELSNNPQKRNKISRNMLCSYGGIN